MCQSNSDCTSSSAAYCEVSSGICIGCLKDEHCKAEQWAKVCDPKLLGCQECKVNSDCGASSLGNTCTGGICVCATDADCAKHNVGLKCNATIQACGCVTSSDCPKGKACTETTSFGSKYCK